MEQQENAKSYYFNGQYFLDYLDYDEFKKTVEETTGIQHANSEEFSTFYVRAMSESKNKPLIDKIFFENILYGRLTNVFINKITNLPPKEEVFKANVKLLIENLNERNNLSEDVKELMIPDGFYLMDQLYTDKERATFIAGLDITKTVLGKIETARFLIVTVVPTGLKTNRKMKYLITGVEINYINQLCCLYVKNLSDILPFEDDSEEDSQESINSVIKNHKQVFSLIKNHFDLISSIKDKEDRKGMFLLCKSLTDDMLKEIKQEVESRIESVNSQNVENLVESMFSKPYTAYKGLVDRSNLENRFMSLMIATYIQVMFDDEGLIDIAKDRKLPGYPTKVTFKSENASKGSTGSSGANSPVATSVMFHSLHTDFEEALELPNWAISWFRDINHENPNNCEVAQTSINCKSQYFQIVFKNNKFIGRELLMYVITELSRYRQY